MSHPIQPQIPLQSQGQGQGKPQYQPQQASSQQINNYMNYNNQYQSQPQQQQQQQPVYPNKNIQSQFVPQPSSSTNNNSNNNNGASQPIQSNQNQLQTPRSPINRNINFSQPNFNSQSSNIPNAVNSQQRYQQSSINQNSSTPSLQQNPNQSSITSTSNNNINNNINNLSTNSPPNQRIIPNSNSNTVNNNNNNVNVSNQRLNYPIQSQQNSQHSINNLTQLTSQLSINGQSQPQSQPPQQQPQQVPQQSHVPHQQLGQQVSQQVSQQVGQQVPQQVPQQIGQQAPQPVGLQVPQQPIGQTNSINSPQQLNYGGSISPVATPSSKNTRAKRVYATQQTNNSINQLSPQHSQIQPQQQQQQQQQPNYQVQASYSPTAFNQPGQQQSFNQPLQQGQAQSQVQTQPQQQQQYSNYGQQVPNQQLQYPHGYGYQSPTQQQIPQTYGNNSRPVAGMPTQAQQAQRPRIDPDQVPSPIEVMELDQKQYESAPYITNSRCLPPLSTTKFLAVDEGNCNPRFLRMTTYNVPATDEISNNVGIPLGCIIQPFASVEEGEQEVPVADCGPKGPLRCARCAAYINPYFRFVDGGRKTVCNICQHTNEVPDDYFMNLDMSGRRMDADQRPELSKGVFDIVATKEYCNKPPAPTAYVFAIDVTWGAQQSGMLYQIISTIKDLLYNPSTPTLPKGTKIGLVTFDRSVHFYNLNSTLEQAQMMLVPDINEIFIPLKEGFLVDPIESKHVIEQLLNILPQMFINNRITEPAVGAAIQSIQSALADRGGRLSLFLTLLPNFGPGQLRPRDEIKILGTDKERQLYEPQDVFWRRLGQDLCVAGVSVDTYFFPNSYIDVATVGVISQLTSGTVHLYPGFDVRKHGERLYSEIFNELTKPFVFDCLLRVRVSNGMHTIDHYGNFYMRNSTDVEIAGMTNDKSIAVEFKHESKLDIRQDVYIQIATLYTSYEGNRRIRLINLALPCTTDIPDIYRNADHESTVGFLTKKSSYLTSINSLESIRKSISLTCIKILSGYRKYGVANSSPGQLILPETYKVLPVFILSLLKNKSLRESASNMITNNNVHGGSINSDTRVQIIRLLKGYSVLDIMIYLYPRLICISDDSNDSNGNLKLIRCSILRLKPESVYLLYNGIYLYLSLGPKVTKETLIKLFGTETQEGVFTLLLDPARQWINLFINKGNENLINNIYKLTNNKRIPIKIVRVGISELTTTSSSTGGNNNNNNNIPGIPSNIVTELINIETEFRGYLVEDFSHGQPSYTDFLCDIHRSIQTSLND